ncbi:MAG: Tfp pilus assembly protein FimT/FimU, partial [Acidiferrobacterales bacterium]
MMNFRAKTGAEMRQTGSRSMPFVGPIEPFVGHSRPPIRPLVCPNRPFVCIGGESGFTLVELIVTLVVAAILLTLAAPRMTSFIQRDRLATQANDLVADLALARSEAIKRGATVIVCKSNNPTAANPACNTTAGDPWTNGRVIFIDNVTA